MDPPATGRIILAANTVEERLHECLRGYVQEAQKERKTYLAAQSTADAGEPSGAEATIFVATGNATEPGCSAHCEGNRRSEHWAACAGLVVQKDMDPVHSRNGPRLQLFRNYADVPSIPENTCKALRRVNWTSFGLLLEDIAVNLDGSIYLRFASTADPIGRDFRLLVIHVLPPQHSALETQEVPRLPKLSAQWEAKIVKDAVEAVLMKVKQSQHLIMLSPFEQRMSCLTHIARSIAGMVADTDNEAFRQKVLQLARCNMADLQVTIQARLEGMALDVIAAAEANAKKARRSRRQKSSNEHSEIDSLDPEE